MKAHLVKKKITDRRGRITSVWVKMNDEFNIPREKMPQVKSKKMDAFMSYLKDSKVGVETEKMVEAHKLKPTQKHLDHKKVGLVSKMPEERKNKPILVSSDGYILDGHHRWAYEVGKGGKLKVTLIDMPIQELIPFIRKWDGVEYSSLTHISDSVKKLASKQTN